MIRPPQLDDVFPLDEALAERARSGSGAAFAALVIRHRDALYAIARNMVATLREAEELFQNAILAAWHELRLFPAGARLTTWLYGIAMKTALGQRQRDRRKPSGSLEPFLPGFDRAGHLLASEGGWFELDDNSSGRIEISGLLREALECIDDQPRAAFVLRDLLQLPVDETAAILKVSPGTVRQDTHRTRLMLRGFIDQL
jgi:RNA polymerase sigma-70 factor (ECF subfamily)